jgi:hypothetical protein
MKTFRRRFEYGFPSPATPAWSGSVERWYQMDAMSFGLAEGAARWQDVPRPDLVLLASPGGSMETDTAFVRAGATSPSRFVHTLPNIRAVGFCQVLAWHGPVLCFQNDPTTCLTALREAGGWTKEYPTIWVVGTRKTARGYEAFLFGGANESQAAWNALAGGASTDEELFLREFAE